MRVPVGAFRLMVNWPASVLRKEGQAQERIDRQAGYETLRRGRPPSSPGRLSARRTQRS